MIYLISLIVGVLSVEILLTSKVSVAVTNIMTVAKKVVHILPNDKISDHWKERVLPNYAIKTALYSFHMLVILVGLFFLFFFTDYFFAGLLEFTMSLSGMLFNIFVVSGYAFLRRSFVGE